MDTEAPSWCSNYKVAGRVVGREKKKKSVLYSAGKVYDSELGGRERRLERGGGKITFIYISEELRGFISL